MAPPKITLGAAYCFGDPGVCLVGCHLSHWRGSRWKMDVAQKWWFGWWLFDAFGETFDGVWWIWRDVWWFWINFWWHLMAFEWPSKKTQFQLEIFEGFGSIFWDWSWCPEVLALVYAIAICCLTDRNCASKRSSKCGFLWRIYIFYMDLSSEIIIWTWAFGWNEMGWPMVSYQTHVDSKNLFKWTCSLRPIHSQRANRIAQEDSPTIQDYRFRSGSTIFSHPLTGSGWLLLWTRLARCDVQVLLWNTLFHEWEPFEPCSHHPIRKVK